MGVVVVMSGKRERLLPLAWATVEMEGKFSGGLLCFFLVKKMRDSTSCEPQGKPWSFGGVTILVITTGSSSKVPSNI